MQSRVKAQNFFDQGLGIGHRPLRARFQHQFHPVANRVHGGFMPCVQKQDAGGDQLIRREAFAVLFGGDQVGDQIIRRLGAALFNIAAQEGHEGLGCSHSTVFAGAVAASHIHAHHGVGPSQQIGGHVFGHAQEAGDDDHRQLLAKMRQQVKGAVGKGVNQLMRQGADLRPQSVNPARGEGAQHQIAQTCVAGGFQFQHRMRLDRVKGPQVVGDVKRFWAFAAKPPVAENGTTGGGVAGAGQIVICPMKERASVAGLFIKWVGVLNKGGVCRRLRKRTHQAAFLGNLCATITPRPTSAAPAACHQFHAPPSITAMSIT